MWGQSPQFRLFLCLYSWLSRHFSPFYSPHLKPTVPNLLGGDFKGFPTIVLILAHNMKVFVLVFGGKHDVDVFSTFTMAFNSL